MLEGKKSYEQLPCKWLEATITFQISLDEVSRQETGRGLALDRDTRDKLMPGWSGLLPPFGVASVSIYYGSYYIPFCENEIGK